MVDICYIHPSIRASYYATDNIPLCPECKVNLQYYRERLYRENKSEYSKGIGQHVEDMKNRN